MSKLTLVVVPFAAVVAVVDSVAVVVTPDVATTARLVVTTPGAVLLGCGRGLAVVWVVRVLC